MFMLKTNSERRTFAETAAFAAQGNPDVNARAFFSKSERALLAELVVLFGEADREHGGGLEDGVSVRQRSAV